MEILTLIKANFRYKKSALLSVAILTLIISVSLVVVLSTYENCDRSIANAYTLTESGDALIILHASDYTEPLEEAVLKNENVEKVVSKDCIFVEKCSYEGTESDMLSFLCITGVDENMKVMNDTLTDYRSSAPELKEGEIFVTQGFMMDLNCQAGDEITLCIGEREFDFTIKAAVLEPYMGAVVIGTKICYISDDDLEMLQAYCKNIKSDLLHSSENREKLVYIHKDNACTLSDAEFIRQVNLDTGIVDAGIYSATKMISKEYTGLAVKIVSTFLSAFIGILFVIVLIVIGHNISAGIEMDYVDLGILKSQGFVSARIRLVLGFCYMISEFVGAAAGLLLAIPVVPLLCNIYQPITGIIIENRLYIGESLTWLFLIFVISIGLIFMMTGKVGKISPVRAISGGRNEIYFDSRLHAPVNKRCLSASLAFRSFISSIRRYIAIIMIAVLLVFFMMTSLILGNAMTSKKAMGAMGVMVTDVDVSFHDEFSEEQLSEIETAVSGFSEIEKIYCYSTKYCSLNGEQKACLVSKYSDSFTVTEGREPRYDNEIIITEILADGYDLSIGDHVVIGYDDKKEDYIITGFFQSLCDTGNCFGMLETGAERIGADYIGFVGFSIAEPEKKQEIVDYLNKNFGNSLEAKTVDSIAGEPVEVIINVIKAVIFILSFVFALVAVYMVCEKCFLQEKDDIAIYHALGFTKKRLRLQFALRFLMIAGVGSVFGLVLSVLFSGKLLSMILRSLGIVSFHIDFTTDTFLIPICFICVCFFLFAYFTSKRIKAFSNL